MIGSQMAFALGARGGLARILMPSAWKTASKEAAGLAGAISDQELGWSRALAEVHQEVTGCLCCPCAVGACGDTGQVSAAGAMLDDDQRVDAPEKHSVHMDEAGREDAAGLRDQELLPGRTRATGYRADPGVVQDLPHRGRGDRVAELDEFALHAPMAQAGLSVAIRITSVRIAAAVGGRPGRRRLV